MAKQRIEEVDLLRGMAAILMILGHSFIVYPVDVTTIPWCHWVEHFIYNFHMELFFVLAGAVYYCSNYKAFIEKKIKRILVPYVFFGFVSLILKAFGGSAINGNESVKEGIIKIIFHGGNYWFLYVLFMIFAIYPWVERALKTSRNEALFGLCILIIRQFSPITRIFTISSILYYLPYFITGKIVFRKIYERGNKSVSTISDRMASIITISGLIIYALLDYIEIKSGREFGSILSYFRAISIIATLYMIVAFVLDKEKSKHGTIYNLVTDCGKYSLQLYLFNGFLLTLLRIIICNIMHITIPAIIVGGIWIGNICITLIACKVIISRIPYLRILCGI